ncbi:MAG: LPD38 domain-containing protein, partial [Bacillota bacterium]
PEQQPQEPGLLSRLGTAAISAIPGAYFFTEPGRKFVSDAAGTVKDYAVGAWQGGAEAMRTEQAVNNMYTDQGSHANPRWGSGELKPEYTQEDADQALAQQDKALQAFTRETLEPTAGIVGAVVAPEVAIPAMIAKQGIDTYQETNDTPVRKALNAMRGMTYGPIADIATDPQLAQKFEKNPARMTANIAMAAGQVLYPLGVVRRGVTGGIRKGNEVISDMNRELSEPIRYAQTHENVGYRDRGAQEINTPLVNETTANKSPVRSALREIRQQEEVPITFEQPKQELSAEFDDIFKNTPKVPVQEQKASPPVESIVVNGVRYTIPKVEGELDLNIFRGDDIPARYTVSDSADFVGTLPETQSRVESIIKAYNREFPDDPILITDGARSQNAGYGSPTSYHKSGEAVDFTSPGLESDPAKRARLVELAQEHGFSEVLDEYSNPSAYATGGHVHMGGLGENKYTGEYVPRESFMEEVPRAREVAEVEPPPSTEVAAGASSVREALAEIKQRETVRQPVREDIQPALRGGEVQPSTGGDVADVTPVTRKQIINELNEIVTTRFGKLLSKGALGEFKVNAETIRSINHGDFQVLAHEVGHFLDKRLNLSDPAFDAELTGWADRKWRNNKTYQQYTHEQRRAEGLAEFVSQYMTDPASAQRNFPNYFNAFEPIMRNTPELQKPINDVGKLMQAWYNQAPEARARGGVSFGYETPKKSIIQRGETAWLKFYETMVDDKVMLDKAVKDIERISGQRIANEKNPYKLSLMAQDSATARAMMLIEEKNPGMVKNILNRIYNRAVKEPVTMRSILDGIKEKEFTAKYPNYLKQGNFQNWPEAFSTYLVARRTAELTSANPKYVSSMSPADAAHTVRNAPAEFASLADKVYKYNDNLLRIAVKENMMSAKAYLELKNKHKDYVPFMRDFSDEAAMSSFLSGKGFGNVASPIKRLSEHGSSEAIINPLESMIKNTYAFLNAVERNRVGRAFVELSEKPRAGRLVEEVSGRSSDSKHSIFTVWDKGVKKSYQTTPELYRAMMSLNKESSNLIVKILSTPAGWLRAGATLTPEFIVRNIMRDAFSAQVYSKHGFIPVFDTFKGIAQVLGKSEMYQEYKASGAMMSTLVGLDRKYTAESISKLISEKKWKKVIAEYNPLELLRNLSDLMESATRVSEYTRARNKGASIMEAGFDAKDITLNFTRAGSAGRQLNKVTAFFNAAVQGGDKMVRAFREDPLGTSLRTSLYVVLPSIMLYTLNKDEEWYQKRPQWEKDIFWMFKGGDTIWRIPKPPGIGIIFGTGAERMLQWWDKKDPKTIKSWLNAVRKDVTPNILPTALTPLYEWWANYSMFYERPIVPQREQKLPENMQYGPYTSELSKFIGDKLDVSPRKVDNTIYGYGGGMSRFGTGIIDFGVGLGKKVF